MKVRFYTPFAQRTGYARAGHDYLLALESAGCDLDVRVLGSDADTDNLEEPYRHLVRYCSELLPADDPRQDPAWPDAVVVHSVPRWAHEFVSGDLVPVTGARKVALTTWETDRLPKKDAVHLNEHFEAVVVPTQWNQVVFVRSGVERVRVVPHAFDPSILGGDREVHGSRHPFVFYSICAWVERKNPIGLLKAYLTEFVDADDVVLRLLVPKGYEAAAQADVEDLVLGLNLYHLPKVEFITERLSRSELAALHATSHCYVSLTRGEGWNLGAFEAALWGKQVIATCWGGHLEFLEHYRGFCPVPMQLTPAVSPVRALEAPVEIAGLKITPGKQVAPPGISGDQCWAEPNLVAAKKKMRAIFAEGPREWRPLDGAPYWYVNVGAALRRVLEG